MASFNDHGKKKKANKSAKLKRSKSDVRREQCHSQDVEVKVDSNEMGQSSPPFLANEEESRSPGSSKSRSKGLDVESSSISNLASQMSSPFGRIESNRWFSELVNEAEDGTESCVDDWEAIADALMANQKQHKQTAEPPVGSKPEAQIDVAISLEKDGKESDFGAQANSRAWQPDDASRPQCLPILLKQHSLGPTCGAINWAWQSIMPRATSCPICYEDLDLTDSSFLPCPCGFRLCLFCHKRILEADERCPGCRKRYELKQGDVGFNSGTTSFRIGRSFSMTAK